MIEPQEVSGAAGTEAKRTGRSRVIRQAEDQGRTHSQAGFEKEPLMVMVKCLPWGRGDYQGILLIYYNDR